MSVLMERPKGYVAIALRAEDTAVRHTTWDRLRGTLTGCGLAVVLWSSTADPWGDFYMCVKGAEADVVSAINRIWGELAELPPLELMVRWSS